MLGRVYLNGDSYDISIVTPEQLKDHEGEAWADLDVGTQEIRISKDSRGASALKILGHELVHAFLWRAGLHEHLEKETEEAVCWAIGAALVELIRDNPELVTNIREAYSGKQTIP